MAPDCLFPPETVDSLRTVGLRAPTLSSPQLPSISRTRLRLYRNLAQFVGRSQFQYRPAFFSELFTRTSIHLAPVVKSDYVKVLVEAEGTINCHNVANEHGLKRLITHYLLAVANHVVSQARTFAKSSGDDAMTSALRHRMWMPSVDMPPRNAVLLRQSTPVDMHTGKALPHVAAGTVKTPHAITDHCFEILVTIFRIGAISIDAVRDYGPAVCIDWDRVFEEHPQEWLEHHQLARYQQGILAEWQERLTAAIEETIETLVQDQVDISFLTTYQRWIVMRLTPETDGSVTIALSPIIYYDGILTPDRPWDHPVGLLACLSLLRSSQLRGVRPYNDVSRSRAYLSAKSAVPSAKSPVPFAKRPMLSAKAIRHPPLHPFSPVPQSSLHGLYCGRTRYTKNGVRCHCVHDWPRSQQNNASMDVSLNS